MGKQKDFIQYTIRRVPPETDKRVREKAAEYGTSINETLIHALQRGLGQTGPVKHHDLDQYAGTWVHDPEFDKVIDDIRQIDQDMWS